MTLPHYIIHVGPHKNGTTYLQHCLAASRASLLESGIYYPSEMISPNNKVMHIPLYYAAKKNEMAKEAKVFETINAAGHKIIVLSCEHFIRLNESSLQSLRDSIGKATFEIVYYVRRWSDRIPSLWNQSLRQGGHLPLPSYCMQLLHSDKPNEDFDYTLSWKKLSNVFGKESLRLVPYSELMDAKVDIFSAFCSDILGVTDIPQPPRAGTSVYASLPFAESEVVRALNSLFFNQHGLLSATPHGSFLRALRRSEPGITPLVETIRDHHLTLVLNDNDPTFAAVLGAMNTYSTRLVGKHQGKEMFFPVRTETKYADMNYLLTKNTPEAVGNLYRQLKLHDSSALTNAKRQRRNAIKSDSPRILKREHINP